MVFEMGGLHSHEDVDAIKATLRELDHEVLGVIEDWGMEQKLLTAETTSRTHCSVLALPRPGPCLAP